MTKSERQTPKKLDKSRARRVAKGSGTTPSAVNKLMKQFDGIQKMTKQMSGPGGQAKALARGSMHGAPDLGSIKGSTKTSSVKAGFKKRKPKKRR